MKKHTFINCLFIILLFFSCQENKKEKKFNGYTITGITLNTDDKMIYLINKENSIIDSSAIVKKAFYLKGTVSNPSNYYFKFKNNDHKYLIILENENFIVNINKDGNDVYGGTLNDKLRNYNNSISKLEGEKIIFLKEIITSNKLPKDYQKRLFLIDENKQKLTLAFINQNTDNLLSTIVFSDNKDLLLNELLQLQQASKNVDNNSFKNVLNTRIVALQKIAEEELVKEKAALALKKAYRKPAIMFSGEGLDNEDVSLQEIIKGKKAILIDFWASWCGPCRIITPSIKGLYTKYKDKGFTILTVSEDKDKASWKKGIAEENMLSWNHIYDDFSRISNMHGVKAIPYMILIDGNGKVIKENITYTQLTKELEKICK
jgi:thiol-disulfide isomerase/thioredoxin